MTRTIFETQTEVGRCAYQAQNEIQYAEPDFANIFAHTVAILHSHRGTMRIEHHSYLRTSSLNTPWAKPEIVLRPALGSGEKLTEHARDLHERFVARLRRTIDTLI